MPTINLRCLSGGKIVTSSIISTLVCDTELTGQPEMISRLSCKGVCQLEGFNGLLNQMTYYILLVIMYTQGAMKRGKGSNACT